LVEAQAPLADARVSYFDEVGQGSADPIGVGADAGARPAFDDVEGAVLDQCDQALAGELDRQDREVMMLVALSCRGLPGVTGS